MRAHIEAALAGGISAGALAAFEFFLDGHHDWRVLLLAFAIGAVFKRMPRQVTKPS